MNDKLRYFLLAGLVVVVGSAAFLLGPSDLFQGNIGKSNIPPWCVKPGSSQPEAVPSPFTPPFVTEKEREVLKWGTSNPGTPGRSYQPEVPVGRGGVARIPGGYEIPATPGNSSGIEINPNPDFGGSGGIEIETKPSIWDNPWKWLTGDDDGGDRGYGGGEETPTPITPEKDPKTGRGNGTTRGGSTGRTDNPDGVPKVVVKGVFEGWYECGCDDSKIDVPELGLTFACPDKNGDSKNYNEPGKYNVNVYKPNNLQCSCPKDYNVDYEKYDNQCDPSIIEFKNSCLNQGTSKKILDLCGDAHYSGPKSFKEELQWAHEASVNGWTKCWTPTQCKQFAADSKSGKISGNDSKSNYDKDYWEKENICIGMGYVKYSDVY